MRFCKFYELAFYILPVKIWQDVLIRRHMLNCPNCRARLAGKEEASVFLVQESDIQDSPDFWPNVESALKPNRGISHPPLLYRWRWVLRAACLLVVVTAGFWLYSTLLQRSPAGGTKQPDRFRLNYIRVDEKPARTFLYQPKDTDMILIWAEKNSGGVKP